MRLQYLATGSADCPLLLLSFASASDASRLAVHINLLIRGEATVVNIHELDGGEPIGDCRRVLARQNWDQAIVRTGPKSFACRLTEQSWDNVAGLLEPFIAGEAGSQWLTGIPGELPLLISTSDRW